MYFPPSVLSNICSYLHQPYDYEKNRVIKQLEGRCQYIRTEGGAHTVYILLNGICIYDPQVLSAYRDEAHKASPCPCRRCRLHLRDPF